MFHVGAEGTQVHYTLSVSQSGLLIVALELEENFGCSLCPGCPDILRGE